MKELDDFEVRLRTKNKVADAEYVLLKVIRKSDGGHEIIIWSAPEIKKIRAIAVQLLWRMFGDLL